jgi:Leucine-rich repeat (LRR) protein
MSSSHVLGVLDLTFQDIKTELDFSNALELQLSLIKLKNIASGEEKNNQQREQSSPTKSTGRNESSLSPGKTRKRPEEIKALRLGNNLMVSFSIIVHPVISSEYIDPRMIQWLDLSFNLLTEISEEALTSLPNLTTIYLHANQISKLSEIKKLSVLPKLKSLTMFGNKVEEHKHYRNFTLYFCTHISHFDMSPVTKSEKQKVIYININIYINIYIFSFYIHDSFTTKKITYITLTNFFNYF